MRDLQEQVRERSWQTGGAGEVLGPVGLDELQAALGATTLLSLMTVRDRVHALVVDARSCRLHEVASARQVREDVLRVRADLDLLAGHALPKPLRDNVAASLSSGLRRLSALVPDDVAAGDGPVLVVPSGQSALVPWPMLAPLRQREVTVAPSATWWATTAARPVRTGGRSVLVSGPDVPRGDPEVRAAAHGADAVVLTGTDATATATLAAMDGASVLHVAAHGRHEPDNPLFSSLLLHDGWLFGHDLDQVRELPEHVVLSACETGMASIRPGDEALGMTSALLHGGTRSVVASVARVGDEVAEQVAVRHHQGLRDGLDPGGRPRRGRGRRRGRLGRTAGLLRRRLRKFSRNRYHRRTRALLRGVGRLRGRPPAARPRALRRGEDPGTAAGQGLGGTASWGHDAGCAGPARAPLADGRVLRTHVRVRPRGRGRLRGRR